MKDTELRCERDRALYRTYVNGLRSHAFSSMQEAAEWAICQPAPKFYVSSKALVNYIAARKAGLPENCMHKQNREKMHILYDMYMAYKTANPNCRLPREHVCEILVDSPAPRYYIDKDMALRILQRERARSREDIIRRVTG